MAKGFSTPIWGPPLWRILHTLAEARHDTPVVSAARIAQWLTTLSSILPCSFCRESYATFLQELQQLHGPLETVIASGTLGRWMYDLHEKVNDKLDRQHASKVLEPVFKQLGCVSEGAKLVEAEDAYRSRRVTYACVQKRFAINAVGFCAQDVWDILAIFSLAYPTEVGADAAASQKAEEFCVFVLLLPDILLQCDRKACSGAKTCSKTVDIVNQLRATPLQHRDIQTTATMFAWAVRLQHPLDGSAWVEQEHTKYLLAEAGACLHGSCI